jgi:class 3 adenylate cyclase
MIDPVTIAAVVSTTLLAPFAKQFGDWLFRLFRKKSEAKVTIRTADGRQLTISASDLTAEDVRNLVEQLKEVKKPLVAEDDGRT